MLHDVGAVEPALMIMSPEHCIMIALHIRTLGVDSVEPLIGESILHSAEIGS